MMKKVSTVICNFFWEKDPYMIKVTTPISASPQVLPPKRMAPLLPGLYPPPYSERSLRPLQRHQQQPWLSSLLAAQSTEGSVNATDGNSRVQNTESTDVFRVPDPAIEEMVLTAVLRIRWTPVCL